MLFENTAKQKRENNIALIISVILITIIILALTLL